MVLVKYNPSRAFQGLEDDFNYLVDNFFGRKKQDSKDNVLYPKADIYEDENKYEIKLGLAGLKKEDIKISTQKSILTIVAERKEDRKQVCDDCLRQEIAYGKFQRSFSLPEDIEVNRIQAKINDGILIVDIEKVDQQKPKEIEIKVK